MFDVVERFAVDKSVPYCDLIDELLSRRMPFSDHTMLPKIALVFCLQSQIDGACTFSEITAVCLHPKLRFQCKIKSIPWCLKKTMNNGYTNNARIISVKRQEGKLETFLFQTYLGRSNGICSQGSYLLAGQFWGNGNVIDWSLLFSCLYLVNFLKLRFKLYFLANFFWDKNPRHPGFCVLEEWARTEMWKRIKVLGLNSTTTVDSASGARKRFCIGNLDKTAYFLVLSEDIKSKQFLAV